MALEHVQPGDLITSQLINAIIDALGKHDETLVKLDDKIDKCCAELKPKEPDKRVEPFIKFFEPADVVFEQTVEIVGGGFIPGAGNDVVIGTEQVKKFGKVTESLIQAVVPTLALDKKTTVPVLVKNENGIAKGELSVGPRAPDVAFVPTPPEVVEMMLKLAGVKKGDVVYDLGSGDGRVVIMAATTFGAGGVGIDIDPRRIAEAEALAAKAKVTDRVKFQQADLFTADLADATVIALHLLPNLNLKLRPTLEKLKAGTRIVSHAFDMGDWKPTKQTTVKTDREHDVYLWIVPQL